MTTGRHAHSRLRFNVRVQPRASANAVVGMQGDTLRVRLQAPPVDGAANEALVRFLAEALEVPRRQVRIVAGAASRNKVVEVDDLDPSALQQLTRT